jgi:hypothetical protein
MFAGQWMELEIIIFSDIKQAQKSQISRFLSYAESRSKMIKKKKPNNDNWT